MSVLRVMHKEKIMKLQGLTFEYNDKSVTMSILEAKELYMQLHSLFGNTISVGTFPRTSSYSSGYSDKVHINTTNMNSQLTDSVLY